MKTRLTVRQIANLGLWSKVCEYKGWNPWIRNEGQITDDEVVEFDDEFIREEDVIKCKNCGEVLTSDMEIEYSDWCNEFFCKPDCAKEYYFQQMESRPFDIECDLEELNLKIVDGKILRK